MKTRTLNEIRAQMVDERAQYIDRRDSINYNDPKSDRRAAALLGAHRRRQQTLDREWQTRIRQLPELGDFAAARGAVGTLWEFSNSVLRRSGLEASGAYQKQLRIVEAALEEAQSVLETAHDVGSS